MDFSFFFIILILLGAGLISLFSASAFYTTNKGMDSLFYVKRQALWMIFGLGLTAIIARMDLEKARRFIKPGVIITAFLLLLTLFSHPIAHVRRWLPLGIIKLQTSEFAKIILVLYLADFFDHNLSHIAANPKQLLKPLGVMTVLLGLIAAEPDLGTPTLMFGAALLMFFAAGVKTRYILMSIAATTPVLIFELFFHHGYRLARLKTFIDPSANATGAGYQLAQSLLAVGSGGWLGKGAGASQIKLMYLPVPHTDFIFPVIAEEVGFIGSILIVLLFLALLIKGVRIARKAPSFYTTLTALGLTLMIVLQAFFNISMATGIIPTKGIPLPFFSYGGSSIMATLVSIGIILNISAHRNQTE